MLVPDQVKGGNQILWNWRIFFSSLKLEFWMSVGFGNWKQVFCKSSKSTSTLNHRDICLAPRIVFNLAQINNFYCFFLRNKTCKDLLCLPFFKKNLFLKLTWTRKFLLSFFFFFYRIINCSIKRCDHVSGLYYIVGNCE